MEQQSLVKMVNPSEKQILTSLKLEKSESKIILNYIENKQIANFQKEDSDKLVQALKAICEFSIGIKSELKIEAIWLIVKFINRHYSDLTLPDVIDAFEQYCLGTLGEMQHYGQFSVDFIGKVLKKYCKHRDELIRNFRIAQENAEKKQLATEREEKRKNLTPEEKYQELIQIVEKTNKIPDAWVSDEYWAAVAEHLKLDFSKEKPKELVINHIQLKYPNSERLFVSMEKRFGNPSGNSRRKIRNFLSGEK